jgi:hypothetical protein
MPAAILALMRVPSCCTENGDSFYIVLTLSLLMSHIYVAPSKARHLTCIYIYIYIYIYIWMRFFTVDFAS